MEKNIQEIINYIENIPRLGCAPFKYVDKNTLKSNYNIFKLIKIKQSDFKLWNDVIDYDSNPTNRIRKKTDNIEKWEKIYSDPHIYPIVIGNDEIIDGHHRLAAIRKTSNDILAWVPINHYQ